MKHILLTLMVFGSFGCSEMNAIKEKPINLSCSATGTNYYSNYELFKKDVYEGGWKFSMTINRSNNTIDTGNLWGRFYNLSTSDLKYMAYQYKLKKEGEQWVENNEVSEIITVDRINLTFSVLDRDSYMDLIGGPKKQTSTGSGSCVISNKI
jgi:hypothetical protein